MKQVLKLPIELKPYIQCYHNMAFPLSVIQGNAKEFNKDFTPWIIGKYLNCTFEHTPSDNKFEIYAEDSWGVDEGILENQVISLKTELYNKLRIDIIKNLKMVMNDGWYIHGIYNERYIPGKDAYLKYNYGHDYILYGYNDDKGVLYSLGYLSNKKYVPYEIPYDNYILAFYKNPMSQSDLNLFKYNPLFEFQTNIFSVAIGLNDYLNSSNSYMIRPNFSYGLTAIKKLKEYIQSSATNNDLHRIDDRYTRALAEHKYLTMKCIKYLAEKKINISSKEIDLAENIYQKSKMVHMLGIKFNLEPSSDVLESIMNGFKYIIDNSNETLRKVVEKLKYI